MSARKYDTFLFDLGRVIVDFDHCISAGKIAALCRKSAEEIYDMFFDSDLTKKFDRGRVTPEEFVDEVKRILNIDISYEGFVAIWNNIFSEKKDVSAFIRQVKKDYQIALISNVNVLQYTYIKKKFSIMDEFEKVILSYEVGVQKPDPLIYDTAIKVCDRSPENIIYIDDRPELIEGGQEAGLESIVFTDLGQLRQDLDKLGIVIDGYRPEVAKSLKED